MMQPETQLAYKLLYPLIYGDEQDRQRVLLSVQAEDFSDEEDSYEIITDPDGLLDVQKALEEQKIPMASAEVTMIPQNYVSLTDEENIKWLNRTLDLLDEDDDVQNVYTNWEEEEDYR